ncbi:MAG: SMC family ATPase, partial [Coprobacillus sp.]
MMKIISLTMNAFLAYKEKTTIDFENMIDHGLYLISGPTGAGKTTIFDAMTFALYGVASGSERNSSYFRSDYADDKEETYVELVFELHQQIYSIKRSPTYTRPGYKTAKSANAILTYKDHVIEGIKEVNQKINELIGVDVHQFKQIVMIAQGEFTKLIYASSEERERVLRHIFHSESLVSFENILREETKKYKDNYML